MKHKRADIIDAIIKMRIEKGSSTKTIVNEFLMGQLGYKTSYAYDLYKQARTKIVELYDVQNKELANEALGTLESLYEDAITNKEKKLALEIRKEINKLTGLYAAEKIDIRGSVDNKIIIEIIKNKDKDED